MSMIRAPWPTTALAGSALLAYCANAAVGAASVFGVRVPRRLHARLFVLTASATVVAAAACFASQPVEWRRGLCLAGALVPMSVLPVFGRHAGSNPLPHTAIAITAAPAFAAALALGPARREVPA